MALPTTIYVDLDDVLCQAACHFLVIIEREFGKQIAYEQLTHFDVGHSCGLTPGERDELYRIVHRPEELLRMSAPFFVSILFKSAIVLTSTKCS